MHVDLIVIKNMAKKVKQINKKDERLQHKEDYNIPIFIPIYARNLYALSFQMHEQLPLVLTILRTYFLPLNIRPLLPLTLIYSIEDNRCKEDL